MNSNLVHNILNIAIALLAGLTAILIATGCTTLPTGVLECSKSWISPSATTILIAVMGVSKTLINVVRDGFKGLTKPQPPVQQNVR